MREAEYKVWCEFTSDGEKHTEMAGPENWFLLTQTGKLMSHGPMGRFNPNIEQQHDKLVVLFSTGIRDRNDKQAFKDDIVLRDSDGPKWIVSWNDIEAGFYLKCLNRKYPNQGMSFIRVCQIVGNAHENPDLLK